MRLLITVGLCVAFCVALLGCSEDWMAAPERLDQMDRAIREQFHQRRVAVADSSKSLEGARQRGKLAEWFHLYRHPDRAVQGYAIAAEADPDGPWLYLWMHALKDSGDLQRAEKIADRIDPRQLPQAQRSAYHLHLAELQTQRGAADLAKASFEHALEANPRSARSLVGLALLELEADRPAQARTLLEKADALQPGLVAVGQPLGRALLLLGERKEATRLLSRNAAEKKEFIGIATFDPWLAAFEQQRTGMRVELDRGERARAAGNLEAAVGAFVRALSVDDDNLSARTRLVETLLSLGRKSAARSQAESAVAAFPTNADAHFLNALVLAETGDRSAALSLLKEIIHDDAQHAAALYLASQLSLRSGLIEEAAELAGAVLDLAAEPGDAVLFRTVALLHLGRTDDAKELLEAYAEEQSISAHEALRLRLDVSEIRRAPSDLKRMSDRTRHLTHVPAYWAETQAMLLARGNNFQRARKRQRQVVASLEFTPKNQCHLELAKRRERAYAQRRIPQAAWELEEGICVAPVASTMN